ncbi:hypothetical protein ACEWY4_008702 [Coilia grayii]|uniref:Ig-like domain-containing protein n=1 Tax=Coilia grayii TaxID=363190 RepID=A0ABD1KBK9_9TELE
MKCASKMKMLEAVLTLILGKSQPNISVRAPDGGLFWGPQGPEVTRGHSLSILCCTEAQYQGGSFHLLFDGSNTTRTQSALNHSASFYIPELDHSHQGNYSCVYEVTVSRRAFNSTQTEPLTLFVKESLAPIIAAGVVSGLILLMVITAVFYLVQKKCFIATPQRTFREHSNSDEDENIYMNAVIRADQRDPSEEEDGDEEDYVNVREEMVHCSAAYEDDCVYQNHY